MTDYVLSIDPGLSTGIALLSYDAETPAQLVQSWQFSGGVAGFLRWRNAHTYEFIEGCEVLTLDNMTLGDPNTYWGDVVTVIAEKFTARNTKGFAYTTASLEPLRGEGALIALGLMPDYDVKEKRWRDPNGQYIFGGTDKSTKKKAQHAWLKENGFYRTNKDFPDSPTKDKADDFRSAAAHGVGYIVKELKHKPTWNLVRGYSDGGEV